MRRFLPLAVFLTVVILGYAMLAQDTKTAAASQKKGGGHPAHQVCANTGEFTSDCNPFGNASVPHKVDKTCGLTGDAKSDGDKAQDQQKNNLCASGTPHALTIKDLTALQADVDKSGV